MFQWQLILTRQKSEWNRVRRLHTNFWRHAAVRISMRKLLNGYQSLRGINVYSLEYQSIMLATKVHLVDYPKKMVLKMNKRNMDPKTRAIKFLKDTEEKQVTGYSSDYN